MRRTVEQRLKQKIEIRPETGDCWNWIGSKSPQGIGIININKHTHRVQKVSYATWIDPDVPDHAVVVPICGNKLCINPNHLMIEEASLLHPGTTSHKKGSLHPLSKLKREDVMYIRNSYALKERSQTQLARQYDVSLTTIRSILSNRTWKGI